MRYLIVFLLALPGLASAQKARSKESEFQGVIDRYIASGVAYDVMQVRDGKVNRFIKFDSRSAKEVMANFPVGSQVSGVSKGFSHEFKSLGGLASFLNYMADSLIYLNSNGQKYVQEWKPRKDFVHFLDPNARSRRSLLLDQKVTATVAQPDINKILYLNDGSILVTNAGFPVSRQLKDITKGDVVSAIIGPIELLEGEVYPIADFKKAYFANLLMKIEGTIESFYFDQNTVCIGMRLRTGTGTTRQFQFPSEHAAQIMEWEKRKEPILVYFNPYILSLPSTIKIFLSKFASVQAIISRSDTLKITDHYFGDPDGKHEYADVKNSGKITRSKTSTSGTIYGIVVDDKYFLEVNKKTESQLKKYFRPSVPIEFEGKQRIKKPGEVYEGNYEIVTPTKMTIAGKEFLLISP
ncbi:MAG: hypothetical protein ACK5V5_13905 [Cyclobacteriaceae bacterium]|jgi:hypothetical protein|nr:hypothetical protein [Flammeovirgaceae bacterium]